MALVALPCEALRAGFGTIKFGKKPYLVEGGVNGSLRWNARGVFLNAFFALHFNHADISWLGIFDVAENTSADLQDLIDRLRGGEVEARRELLQRAHDRLLRIAATVFHEDFPALRDRHELESVVSEVWMRLVGALEATQPQTVEGFFGLVFHKVRQVLLDMASRQRRDDLHRRAGPLDANDSAALAACDRADTTHDPARLAALTELHDQIEKLPAEQRTVFDLHYYGGYSQVDIAQMLKLNPKQVSRLWLAATGRLAMCLDGFDGLN
jgi:RNA polymerase sigma factor (sigma-70 family)